MASISSKVLRNSQWGTLIGEWEISAPIFQAARGIATFEWIEGGAYLALRSTPPEPAPASVWLIGTDNSADNCVALYSDTRGVSRIYRAQMEAGIWSLARSGKPFSQRFEARLDDKTGALRGTWYSSDDEVTWKPDFDLVYSRRRA
jgi:hypothetical protein